MFKKQKVEKAIKPSKKEIKKELKMKKENIINEKPISNDILSSF